MANRTYTFLAKDNGPPDTGLLQTKDGYPAVVVFTTDGVAEAYDRRDELRDWRRLILLPRDYVARLKENHDRCKVLWAMVDPDEHGRSAREEKLLRLIDQLEKAHNL